MHVATDAPRAAAGPAVAQALATSTLAFRTVPGHTPDWITVDALTDSARWRDIADRYSRHIGTPHTAIGGVCALQHYTGRLLQPVVAVWAVEAAVLDLQQHRWWARLDEEGATREVSCPGLPIERFEVTPEELTARIREHVAPLVSAVCEATGIVERVALGGVAASFAGALQVCHQGIPRSRRSEFRLQAERAVAHLRCGGRQLVSLVDLDIERQQSPTAAVFSHDRRTCCLIRLGRAHRECDSCPQLPESERRRRQHSTAFRSLRPRIDLRSAGDPIHGS
ncbi:hypothetical protein M1C57_23915 (plasmid) [Rhodococcus pyridinivorans]|uniref:hypothetical protein n=1 Tax=Rhodococcus pyridinivorans TaxID=103816 RepID=UPI00200B1E89|nr:hypothetical protein [Rhodococcus pyridinivorans]UPW06937.1 hypothetical protein M1C57_23915 [Rhodococcus pyridinivorans]